MSGRALLEVEGLRVGFRSPAGAVTAVDGIDLEVGAGSVHGLVGESGSGKTATALALAGLNRAEAASISGRALLGPGRAGGEEVELLAAPEHRMRSLRGDRLSIVFQDPLASLNPYMRVADQVSEALRAHRDVSRSEARGRALELLDEVGVHQPARHRTGAFPHELSGGMRQRVMIAIAIANRPDLLIADEPTTALDVTTQAEILDLVDGLRRSHGIAVLLITHDLGVVAERSDRVSVMREGRIVASGTTAGVLGSGDPYTRELIESVPRVDRPRGGHRRRGRGSSARAAGGPEALLEVDSLSVELRPARGWTGRRREPVRAVDGVDLRLSPGDTLGVVGESGSGKSTLCRLIARLIDPGGGTIRLEGREIGSLSQRQLRPLRARMQMVFQDPYSSLNPRRRAGEIVAAPIAMHGLASGDQLAERVVRLLERVGLQASDARRHPHELSAGQRQRIAIARALGPEPGLLLADEPVSALDVTVQARILSLLEELSRERGLAMILVSHDLGVVRQVADRILVMRDGRAVEEGPAERICTSPSTAYTQRLLDAVPSPEIPPGGGQSSLRMT